MVLDKAKTFYLSNQKYLEKYAATVLVVVVFLFVGVATYRLQNRIVDFERGYNDAAPPHHGWVTSHTLAIIKKATPENGFVGYARAFIDSDNNKEYDYFDRYPVFFSAIFHQILSLRSKLSIQIYLAKQVMNLIFIATMVMAFLIVNKFTESKQLALAVILFAFSNRYLLYYKDMVHYDQPGLFGFLLLIFSIALRKLEGKRYPVYLATFFAIALGRGYASYAVMGLWIAVEAFLILRSPELKPSAKLKNILKHDSFFILVIGIVWGAGLLSYNITVEAQKRNVPPTQTSIIEAANDRLGLVEDFNQQYNSILNWWSFSQDQAERIIRWAFPVPLDEQPWRLYFLILGFMLLVSGAYIKKQSANKRVVLFILLFSGFAWLFPMRNLAAFHEYTTMFYIGLPLIFYLSVFSFLKPSRESMNYLLFASIVVYIAAIVTVRDFHYLRSANLEEYTFDFMRINEKIEGIEKNVYAADEVPRARYALGFYLADHYLSPIDAADYVIARDKNYLPNNLTPDNDVIYLFEP